MSDKKWFRVVDPLSPLFGCDVKLGDAKLQFHRTDEPLSYSIMVALRRVDIFVGDRPFQLVASQTDHGDGDLGLMIEMSQLIESPVQCDVIELSKSNPYGKFVKETNWANALDPDALQGTLQIVRFENAVQAALKSSDGKLIANNTWVNDDNGPLDMVEKMLLTLFGGSDVDELITAIKGGLA